MADQVEAACDAALDKLRAGLNAKIDQINAAHDDGIVLEQIPEEHMFFGVRADFPCPCVMVVPRPTKPESDQGSRILWDHEIQTMAWAADPDDATITRRVLRYEQAVRDVLLQGRAIGDGGYGIGHRRDDRSIVFQDQPDIDYVQAARSVFWVKQQQDVL